MGLRFPLQKSGNCFFVTTSFKDKKAYGNVPGMYKAMSRSIAFCCEKYGSKIIGYVFMPTHIHLLVAIEGFKLGDWMRDFKKFIAQKEGRVLNLPEKSIWQYRYDRMAIETKRILEIKLNYIHFNPVRAGVVDNPSKWYWSSAGFYLEGKAGPISIYSDWL